MDGVEDEASSNVMSAVRAVQNLCQQFALFKSYATGSGFSNLSLPVSGSFICYARITRALG